MNRLTRFITPLAAPCALAFPVSLAAQPALDLPRQSPPAVVSQTFGYTTATVKYSRPAVNGRVIWGGLVPYDRVWRAGANEPTTVEFTRDVEVNGTPLSAGTYGLFVLPEKKGGKDTWTFIFSRNAKGWGAYGYDAKDDALRVAVAPEKASHRERMAFAFDEVSDAGAVLSLHWAGLKGTLNLTSEFVETGKANILKGLPDAKPDDAFARLHAARFYREQGIDRDQAMKWLDESIAIRPMFPNLWVKAQWLAEDGRCKEALDALAAAKKAAGDDVSLLSQLPDAKKTKGWCK